MAKGFQRQGDWQTGYVQRSVPTRDAKVAEQKAIQLAKQFNSDLHVLHITTEDEIKLFNEGSIEGKKITSEVCIPHLILVDSGTV